MTTNRSPSRVSTIRLPSRRTPFTTRPTTSESGGCTERSTNGVASRMRSRRAPTTRSRSASTYTVTSGSSGIVAHERIDDAIDRLTVLGDVLAMPGLERVAGFLEHAHRRRVPLEDARLQSAEIERPERVFGDCAQRLGRDAAAPVRLTQPVA